MNDGHHCHDRRSICPLLLMDSLIIEIKPSLPSLSRLTIEFPIVIDGNFDHRRHDRRLSYPSWSMDVIVTIDNRVSHRDRWTAWSSTSRSTIELPIVINGQLNHQNQSVITIIVTINDQVSHRSRWETRSSNMTIDDRVAHRDRWTARSLNLRIYPFAYKGET